MGNDKSFKWTIVLFLIGVILTSVSLYWFYFDVFDRNGISVIKRLPYVRMSILITVVTTFFGVIFNQKRQLNKLENIEKLNFNTEMIVMSWCVIIAIFFLVKRDHSELGLGSDEKAIQACVSTVIIQCSLIYLISYRHNFSAISRYRYMYLLGLSILSIFLVKLIY